MREWLKNIRETKGYSTYKVAELAEISQSYYYAIECGERGNPLNVDVAKKIAHALDFEWIRFYDNSANRAGEKTALQTESG